MASSFLSYITGWLVVPFPEEGTLQADQVRVGLGAVINSVFRDFDFKRSKRCHVGSWLYMWN